MPLDFPTNPSLNDTYSFGGKTWIWNGQGWQLSTTGAINDIPIGNITPSTGAFTTLMANTANVTGNVSAGYFIGNIEGATGDFTGNVSVNTVLGNIDGGTGTFTGNVSGNYFLGNGSQLTGLPEGYGNANVIALGESGWGGNILPSANITYDLGNSTNRWRDIYLANSTIYLGEAEISANATAIVITNPLGGEMVMSGVTTDVQASTVTASGNVTAGNVTVTNEISAGGNITAGNVSGTNITGTLTTAAQTNITSVGTLGSLSVTGNVSGGNLTTAGLISASGNVSGGNLNTAGAVIITGTGVATSTTTGSLRTAGGLGVAGNAYVGGDVQINAQGQLRLADSDSSNWVAFRAPATVTGDVTWTLPAADGTANQVLTTNGSGTLSWNTASLGGASNAYAWFIS